MVVVTRLGALRMKMHNSAWFVALIMVMVISLTTRCTSDDNTTQLRRVEMRIILL